MEAASSFIHKGEDEEYLHDQRASRFKYCTSQSLSITVFKNSTKEGKLIRTAPMIPLNTFLQFSSRYLGLPQAASAALLYLPQYVYLYQMIAFYIIPSESI